jgi:thiol-disulfide isomerase/thioredoxin
MSASKRIPALILAIFATLGAGYAAHFLLDRTPAEKQTTQLKPPPGPGAGLLQELPAFAYPDLEGVSRSSEEWLGRVLVLNFWATWCPPCLREMPDFIEFQERHGAEGLQFVGIAIDSEKEVADFADGIGINYPILLGETDAIALSQSLGNRFSGLPFSAIFDRRGKLVHTQAGELKRADLEQYAIPLL